MIRIITWLDPHFIDVYETGAWHMDYNFTDFQHAPTAATSRCRCR